MEDRIGVINYGGGNLRNVLNVLTHLGFPSTLVTEPGDLAKVDRLLFPGVGAFGECAVAIDQQKLREPLVDWIRSNRPYFGICLGYQILFERSAECPELRGLGVFAGEVVRFPEATGRKIPHMGWNVVIPADRSSPIWQGTPDPLYLYFVHSYFPVPGDPDLISSTACYGGDFAASISQGNLFAGQFHPERSQQAGLKLVDNFLTRPLA